MLAKLELQQDLQTRTNKALKPKLVFMYKEVEGLIHAIEPDEFLLKACPKRTITAEKFKEYHETIIVEKQVKNNSYCECIDIPPSKTPYNIQTHFRALIIWYKLNRHLFKVN